MATSNPYSFIQFGAAAPDSCCDGINTICLPVVSGNDLRFQIISDSAPGSLEVLRGIDGSGDVVSSNSGFALVSGNIYKWESSIDYGDLEDGECFQFRVGSSYSNCFQKRTDDCFTTVLNYYNNTDYAGFIYCNAGEFVNRVRLPLYLSKPKLPEDRGVYRKSNGMFKITKSVITKEYQVQTDFMPQQMHEALIVAMNHDVIEVQGSEYTGAITKSSEYNQPWDDDMCVVQADFKVAATPFSIRNNNCQVCEDPVVDPPDDCIGVAITGSPSLPDAVVGEPYSYSFDITGDTGFAFSNMVYPGWLTFGITGHTVNFSGTPTSEDVGTGVAVSFTISNCDGVNTVNFSDTIDVIEVEEPPADGINWSFNNLAGAEGHMSIIVNGVTVISTDVTDSGSFPTTVGDEVSVTVNTSLENNANISISGPYNNSSSTTHFNADEFIVAPGTYIILGQAN